jgi:hypothetical protein
VLLACGVRPKLRREQVVVGVEIGLRVAQVLDFAGKLGVVGHQVFVAEKPPANLGAGCFDGGGARLGWRGWRFGSGSGFDRG